MTSAFAGRRPDVKVYQTDALKEDITLTGRVWAICSHPSQALSGLCCEVD